MPSLKSVVALSQRLVVPLMGDGSGFMVMATLFPQPVPAV